jgi:hypothetical protein
MVSLLRPAAAPGTPAFAVSYPIRIPQNRTDLPVDLLMPPGHLATRASSPVATADAPPVDESRSVDGEIVRIGGESFYRIRHHDAMPPFLMSIISSSDHWLFVSSNGALTAGRRSPDDALFPYYNDDRIHDSQDQTGGKTILRLRRGDGHVLWEPFSERYAGLRRRTRALFKSVLGDRVIFSETDHDLDLRFTQQWSTSARFGFVRRCTLTNLGSAAVAVDVLDGIQNLLPAGVDHLGQMQFSALVDGYKDNELDEPSGLGVFRLSALRSDVAEPSESLRVTTVWSRGLGSGAHLLSTVQLDRFRAGGTPVPEGRMRGRRGAYLVTGRCVLRGHAGHEWIVVADVARDAADVVALRSALSCGTNPADSGGLVEQVEADVAAGSRALRAVVAAADGVQCGADALENCCHHANTLFNIMRGGIPDDGYLIRRDALTAHIGAVSVAVLRRHRALLGGLPEALPREQLLAVVAPADPALERIVREYLPLRYSRRHGDPSRPWNTFTIAVTDRDDNRILGYEGNWRDIFQNWEALAHSYPGHLESMIFKFVNSSTADGHNPFFVTQDGFDWERVKPGRSSMDLGYWGDHQVIYLLKFLEASARFHPGRIGELLHRQLFTYADVPYRIKDYRDLLQDPHRSVDFDAGHDEELGRRRAERGTEGALLAGADGEPLRVTLAEKLLLVALTTLTNYVPGAGIWLNTQRPEWNDGNNALVGYGVSVVTLCHLRRYLVHCRGLFAAGVGTAFSVTEELARLFRQVSAALVAYRPPALAAASDQDRKVLLDALGTAGSDYRSGLYARGLGDGRIGIDGDEVDMFCVAALRHLDHAIRMNRRPDGMYHAYNLMRVTGDDIRIRHLYPMLEGQVAALSSGLLPPAECVAVLDALRAGALYRPDQNSYLLYPDRELPLFLDKGVLPAGAAERSELLTTMLRRDDRRIVVRDGQGTVRFHADLRNAADLAAVLGALTEPVAAAETPLILDLYEEVFDHESFTGRSGTFFKYEGLGCIYWHMVSKLRLAVHELLVRYGDDPGTDPVLLARLRAQYEAIRDGIGVHKSPQVHGAVPVDPYSHTPGFAGAQQPGMTGQVKEDILCRLGELGVQVQDGRLGFRPDLVRTVELLTGPAEFRHVDVRGRPATLELVAGSLGFTVSQVPVILHRGDPARIVVSWGAAAPQTVPGLRLDGPTSAHIFARTGEIARLDVHLGLG